MLINDLKPFIVYFINKLNLGHSGSPLDLYIDISLKYPSNIMKVIKVPDNIRRAVPTKRGPNFDSLFEKAYL